eukprot:13860711-Alexandrium_andersonii.AAC.1
MARNLETLEPRFSEAGTRGAALRAAPPAPDLHCGGAPMVANSEPRRRSFGPLGTLEPRPPRKCLGESARL